MVAAVRAAVGPDFTLMVDVQYAFDDAEVVANMVHEWDRRGLNVFFIECVSVLRQRPWRRRWKVESGKWKAEQPRTFTHTARPPRTRAPCTDHRAPRRTPLRMDQIQEMAKLHKLLSAGSPDGNTPVVRVAYGEWQATRFEMEELMDAGCIDVAQPDVGRIGGLTEARRVCRMAAARGKTIVPHCWKTAIGIAATAHLAAANPHCAFIEFLPPELTDSELRQRLTLNDELRFDPGSGPTGGKLALPQRPGLGVTVNMEALREFEGYANAAWQATNGGPPPLPPLMDWGSTQGHILSGGGRINAVFLPGRDYVDDGSEMPHALKKQGAAAVQRQFRSWFKEGRRSHACAGAWSRPLFSGGWSESTDVDTAVFNLQTPSIFVDIRFPRAILDRSFPAGGFAACSMSDLRALSRQHCFAGCVARTFCRRLVCSACSRTEHGRPAPGERGAWVAQSSVGDRALHRAHARPGVSAGEAAPNVARCGLYFQMANRRSVGVPPLPPPRGVVASGILW